jgi:hypothetical protein
MECWAADTTPTKWANVERCVTNSCSLKLRLACQPHAASLRCSILFVQSNRFCTVNVSQTGRALAGGTSPHTIEAKVASISPHVGTNGFISLLYMLHSRKHFSRSRDGPAYDGAVQWKAYNRNISSSHNFFVAQHKPPQKWPPSRKAATRFQTSKSIRRLLRRRFNTIFAPKPRCARTHETRVILSPLPKCLIDRASGAKTAFSLRV